MGEVTGLICPPGGGSSQTTSYIAPQSSNADVSIQAAINALSAIGGGVVLLGPGTYGISNPIAMKSGVSVVGVAPQLNYTTNTAPIPDSNLVIANGGGTILSGSGIACFQWNKTVLGVPASGNAFVLTGLSNIALRNLCFTGFTRAVDGGNTNNAAAWYAEFENLYISGCSDYGFWITNFQHCKFRRIYTFGNVNGQFYGNDVPSTTLQPGNSYWEDIFNATPVTNANLSRALVWWVTQGQQNQGTLLRIQSNRNNSSTVTQAATMANASANITITDGTKFAVNMPVTFSASVNGFTQNQIYFVTSVAVNVITVALTIGGTNISATGNAAVNCITSGFPTIEVVAQAGAAISSHDFYNIDAESGGTCAILLHNLQASFINISQVPGNTQSTQSICGRSMTNTVVMCRPSCNTSFDGACSQSYFYGNRMAGSVDHDIPGIYFDAALGYTMMNLSGSVHGLSNQTPDGSNMLIPLTGMVQQLKNKAAAAVTLVGADSGTVVNAYTVGTATWTIATVSSTVKGLAYRLVNPVGTGQNLVITSTSNFFGPSSARTSITMTPGSSMDVVAENDALGSYWAVEAMVGSYAAGTLTGVTP